MRAIHINPYDRTITEVDLASAQVAEEDGGGEGITYEALRAAVFKGLPALGYIEALAVGGPIVAWLDEEGMLCRWEKQRFVRLHEPGNVREGRDLAGNVILCGQRGPNTVGLPAWMTVDLVRRSVTFIDAWAAEVPAPTITDLDTGETAPLGGDGSPWNIDNQPR